MTDSYPLNSHVSVEITRAIPSGLLGRVGEQRAIIRKREVAWDTPKSYDHYIGQTRQAVVIGYNPLYDELELSLRLVEYDPWLDVPTKYRVGTIVQGQVQGLIKNAAFVEVEKGIEGFLPADEILPQPIERIEDVLWVGDHVKAMVLDVDAGQRRLRLSIKELLIQRETEYRKHLWSRYQDATSSQTVAAALPQELRLQLLHRLQEASPTAPKQAATLDVLIVEDDRAFGPGLRAFFQRNGCRVELRTDALTALRDVHVRSQSPFDLIVIDWGLPDLKGHELVHLLQEKGVTSRLLLILEPAPLRGRPEVWRELQETGIDVLLKSDSERYQTDLIAILDELRGSSPVTRYIPPEAAIKTTSDVEQPRPPQVVPFSHSTNIESILDHLQRDARATTVVLVALDSSQRFKTLAHVGEPFPLDEAPPDIIHSPLSDILQANQEVYEQTIRSTSRFARLLAIAPFESFIGVPLPAVMDSARQGVFMLKRRGAFTGRDRELARLAAYMLAKTFTGASLLKSLQPWQAQNLAGQMIASAIHEINNKLLATKLHLDALQELVTAMWHQPHLVGDPLVLQRMEENLKTIATAWERAELLRRQYLALTRGSEESNRVNVNELITDTVQLLHTEAQSDGITLHAELTSSLPLVAAKASLIQQILWNLVLNAIQQMAEIKRQGRIVIQTRYVPSHPRPVHVRVTDEGPGIHTQRWESIFDFGFTTRKGGSGLGLTISRQVAADLGGDLRVEQSHMWWGTAFLLELPQEVKN